MRHTDTMRRALVAAAAVAMLTTGTTRPFAADRVPVIVELFTSEGCSSCPPADDVLARLVATQPVPNAEIIALGEHVDYWDHQGWRDRFSSHQFTERQSEYDAKVFRSGNIYTPQLVVAGVDGVIGSDMAQATKAIAAAARRGSSVRVTIDPIANSGDPIVATIHVDPGATPIQKSADVIVAITEDDLTSNVRAGENSGRELHHVAVVRTLTLARKYDPSRGAWSDSITSNVDPSWRRDRLHVVAFVQDSRSGAILGAAVVGLRAKG